jgi:hypothetical protein
MIPKQSVLENLRRQMLKTTMDGKSYIIHPVTKKMEFLRNPQTFIKTGHKNVQFSI